MEIYKTIYPHEIDNEKEIIRQKRINALRYSWISDEYRRYLKKQISAE